MPHLEVPGASLYYEVDGPSDGPALLLVHSGVANLRMWDAQIPALAAEHRVVRFDTRGYGLTESQNLEFSNRADALAVLDHVGVHKATVVGCSRGGTIAIDLALDSPGRVLGLVVVCGGPSGFPEVELTQREDELFDELDVAFTSGDWETLNRMEVALWNFGPARREEELAPVFVETAYALHAANLPHAAEMPISIPLDPPAYDRISDIDVPAPRHHPHACSVRVPADLHPPGGRVSLPRRRSPTERGATGRVRAGSPHLARRAQPLAGTPPLAQPVRRGER
jgi:3-oxoadipate enol-lactonase